MWFFIYSAFNKITSFPWKLNRYSYGVQFGINCTALDQSKLSNFVECAIIIFIEKAKSVLAGFHTSPLSNLVPRVSHLTIHWGEQGVAVRWETLRTSLSSILVELDFGALILWMEENRRTWRQTLGARREPNICKYMSINSLKNVIWELLL